MMIEVGSWEMRRLKNTSCSSFRLEDKGVVRGRDDVIIHLGKHVGKIRRKISIYYLPFYFLV
jgi:hypothetical protein